MNSVTWAKNPETGKPLLCAAGEAPKQIHVFDIEIITNVRTLVGHGGAINDLSTSPTNPSLIVSASADYTVRLWSLDPKHKDQPCLAIFAGEGHRQTILACHFHANGRWMLTAGLDTAVCLWYVPGLEELETGRVIDGHPAPKTIYYPHFHSTEVHANYVDCVVFYGDLILSRAAKDQGHGNEILLWKIEGFDSELDPPTDPPIPGPGIYSRSSFPHEKGSRGFQRLLTFDMPYTTRFYLRFGLLQQPDMRPILAMGNEQSKFLFWDLQKLEEGYDPSEEKMKKSRGRKSRGGAANAVNQTNLSRMGELRKNSGPGSDIMGVTPEASSTSVSVPPERKYDLGDSFMPLKAHRSIVANTDVVGNHFATAQIAWSPDGAWMIGVGDHGMMCMFHRDKSVV
ncbi:hypothetical protein LTR78_001571 [Recurvomyces mirabilis]|uniref:WD40 repeat-like protein n=1 Tax=Recurvomyces mirabilis TaxID=574656 RepID=A0AAE1C520_9PEZI|nr:hypothetical protein LTR78_001571 [Recurvomyces mirabilis]KAK5151856.1 hypothetical protein LTS14_008990 [Recurvomyces mirabilis]